MATIVENIQTLQSIKSDIKSAILAKGGSVTDAFGGYAQAIKDLPTGGRDDEIEAALIEKRLNGEYSNSYVTSIPESFMYGNSLLTSVNFPNATYIGNYAFFNCSGLSSIVTPNATTIRDSAFANTIISKFDYPLVVELPSMLPSTIEYVNAPLVSYIGSYFFRSFTKLSSYNLPNVTYIGGNTFNNTGVTTADFPKTSYVGAQAFMNCSLITNVNLPNAQIILENAFQSCPNITSLVLSDKVYVNYLAFASCEKLENFSIPSQLVVNVTDNSITFPLSIMNQLSDANKITSYYSRSSSVEDSVWYGVISGIFSKSSLKSIYMENCWFIGDFTFNGFTSLNTAKFPNATYIGRCAFSSCNNILLQTIIIPKAEYIESQAFQRCSRLKTMYLPVVSYIGDYAFHGCSGLSVLTLLSDSVCTLGGVWALSSTLLSGSTGSIIVPASLVDAYKTADYWSSCSSRIFPYEE